MKKVKPLQLLGLLLVATVISYLKKDKFPVKYYICGKGYVDCHAIAKFDDIDSCEATNRKWGWYCNTTDKNNITCREEESDVTDSYCSK